MAYREIPHDEQAASGPANYFKFNAIGDKLGGVFVSCRQGNYGMDYTFRNKTGEHVVTVKGALQKQLEKADLEPGFKVIIEYVRNQPMLDKNGQVKTDEHGVPFNPMKVYKVLVDDSPASAAPKPAPKPAPAADDDF